MPIVNVKDLDLEGLKVYSGIADALLMKSNKAARGLFIAESRRVIERALDHGVIPYSLFVEDRWLEQSRELIDRMEKARPGLVVYRVNHEQMEKLTGFRITRGPMAAFERPRQPDVEELVADARRIALLEDITNFTNIGAIFRSAAALGVDGVILSPRCHDPLYKRAARVSMGAVFQVPWTHVKVGDPWFEPVAGALRAHGFKVVAMDLAEDTLSIRDGRLKNCDKLAMVLGTEGEGITEDTRRICDACVKIPMQHGVDSLNVAAASAVTFWELCN